MSKRNFKLTSCFLGALFIPIAVAKVLLDLDHKQVGEFTNYLAIGWIVGIGIGCFLASCLVSGTKPKVITSVCYVPSNLILLFIFAITYSCGAYDLCP
jgi:hypothetical protein